VADFTTAIIGDPDFGRAYVGRAEAKLTLKNVESAISDFDEAVRVAPEDFEVHVARATFRIRIGNFPGAREDLTNAKAVADEATARKIGEMLKKLGAP
jgi:Flp pilus assembly protein TadD